MEGTRRGLRGVPVPEHVEMGREFDKDRVKTLPPPMGKLIVKNLDRVWKKKSATSLPVLVG